jgi:hypothetical protein
MSKQRPQPKRRKHNATFWRDGTYLEQPYWWPGTEPPRVRAGWKRAAGVVSLAWLAYSLVSHPVATERAVLLVLGPVTGVALVLAFRRWQGWEHDRTVIKPLASRLAGVLDQEVRERRQWLDVPPDYGTSDQAKIVVGVPADFTAAERDMEDITRAVTVSTGWAAPVPSHELKSRHPRLVYAQRQLPPLAVGLPDILPYIEAAGLREIILGLRAGGDVESIDLNAEAPHAAFSGTTKSGKTEATKNAGAQWCYHGGLVLCLDYKLISHMWADQLPSVAYARDPDEIHAAMMWLAWDEYDANGVIVKPSELTRRKRILLAAKRAGTTPDLGPPILILGEERNATNRVIRRHWRRTGGRGGAPALEALDESGETGRELLVHVWHVAQRLSAKASGSDGSRDAMENIGAIITKDAKEATWKLIGDGHPQPPKSGHPGRFQLIRPEGVTEYQGVLYDKNPVKSDAIARKLALSGTVARWPRGMPLARRGPLLVPAGIGQGAHARQEGTEQPFVVGHDDPVLTAGEGPQRAVKLAAMVAAGLFPSIAAARKAAQRQGWQPVGGDKHTGYEYAVADAYEYLNAKGRR